MKIKVKVAHSELTNETQKNDVVLPKPIGIAFSENKTEQEYSEVSDKAVNSNQAIYNEQQSSRLKRSLHKQLHSNTIPWRNYLVYLIILTSLSCTLTFSKYVSRVQSQNTVTAAKFDVSITTSKSNGSALDFGRIDEYSVITYNVKNDSEVTVKATMLVNCSADCDFSIANGSFHRSSGSYESPNIAPGESLDIPLKVFSKSTGTTDGMLNVNFTYEQVRA